MASPWKSPVSHPSAHWLVSGSVTSEPTHPASGSMPRSAHRYPTHDRHVPTLAARYRACRAARARGHRADPASAPSRPCFPNRVDGGRRRDPAAGHAGLSAPRRGEHRPSPRGAAARSPRAHAADPVPDRRGRDRDCRRRRRASPASLSARPLDQRVRARRRQHRAPAARFQRHDRRDGGRHRCRKGSRPCALLHLAAGPQRLQGRRGPEARGCPRRDLPRDGRRPRLAHDDPLRALAGDARGRRARGRGPADRQPAAAAVQGPHRPSEPSQDRGHRRPHHLLRQPELRRSRVPGEGEVRPLGGRRDALRGSRSRARTSTCSRATG